MGSIQSNKKNIVWGPTSINIYENIKNNKKVMFIGDKHSIPEEKYGISLNDMLTNINIEKGIGFITEGCVDSTCFLDEKIDNCMKRAQTCDKVKQKFTMLWADYREKLDIYDLTVSIKLLRVNLVQFKPVWNDNVNNPINMKTMQKIVLDTVNKVFVAYKKIISLTGKNIVDQVCNNYPNFYKYLNKLSKDDKEMIFKYIDLYIYKDVDKTEYEKEFDKYKSHLFTTIKGIFTSFKAGEQIKHNVFYSYIKTTEYFSNTLHNISNAIFEAYMIILVLVTNFNRYIIHSGARHIDDIEKWFKSNLGYKEYFKGKQISTQVIDMKGLLFI